MISEQPNEHANAERNDDQHDRPPPYHDHSTFTMTAFDGRPPVPSF